jgi:hypothetical protein
MAREKGVKLKQMSPRSRITNNLTHGWRDAQRIAGYSNTKATGFCSGRSDDIRLREVERIGM